MDFVWVCSDQASFEWFMNLLHNLDEEMNEFKELQAKKTEDVKGVVLQLALQSLRSESGVDPLTGLAFKTHAGRPDWNRFFGEGGAARALRFATPPLYFSRAHSPQRACCVAIAQRIATTR